MRIISGTARGTNLYTLEGKTTRPTLDRVKEALFNILQTNLREAIVLDLFSGSGALGIESLSRGASKCVFCDHSFEAISIIHKNVEKAHMVEKSEIIKKDYQKALETLVGKYQFDIIFVDPPYEINLGVTAIEKIISMGLLKQDGIILLETDCAKRELEGLKNINANVYDLRKYGRVQLIFLNRKG